MNASPAVLEAESLTKTYRMGEVDLLDRANRELGTTTAVITHNAPIAAMADRVFSLADGRIVSTRRNERRVRVEEVRW